MIITVYAFTIFDLLICQGQLNSRIKLYLKERAWVELKVEILQV